MHSVSLLQAVLIGIWAAIAGIDQFNGLLHIHRPIVTGAIIGIILGEPTMGIITGGGFGTCLGRYGTSRWSTTT